MLVNVIIIALGTMIGVLLSTAICVFAMTRRCVWQAYYKWVQKIVMASYQTETEKED